MTPEIDDERVQAREGRNAPGQLNGVAEVLGHGRDVHGRELSGERFPRLHDGLPSLR